MNYNFLFVVVFNNCFHCNLFCVVIPDIEDFANSAFYLTFIIVNSLTLMLMSLTLYIYGTLMKNNLVDSADVLTRATATSGSTRLTTGSAPITLTEEDHAVIIKLKLLSRINKTLVVLLSCYSLRVLALIYLFVAYLLDIEDDSNSELFVPFTVWFLLSWLIPSVPVSLFAVLFELSSRSGIFTAILMQCFWVVQAIVYLRIMKFVPVNNQNFFTVNDDDSVTNWTGMDDTRLTDEGGSCGWYERYSDSTHGI